MIEQLRNNDFFFLCSPSQTNEDEHKKQSCVLTAVMGSCDKVNGDGFFGVSTEISFPVFMFVAPEAGSDVFYEIKTFWEALRATCEEIILKNPEGIQGD